VCAIDGLYSSRKKAIRAPCEGKPHARCDEGAVETGSMEYLMRHPSNRKGRETRRGLLKVWRHCSTLPLRIAKFIRRIPEEELPTVTIPSDEEMAMRCSATELIRVDRSRTQSINALHSLLWNNGITGFGRNDLRYKKNRDKVIDNLPVEYRAQGIRLLKLIDIYEQCLGEIEEEQKEVLITHRDESTISISMPGIGPKTAFVLLAYLGNMERFSSCRQVGYFSGFTPSADISGQQEHYGSITKQGPKQLRRVMNQAAWAAIRSPDGIILREFYDRVRSTKGKKKAIVAVGRKMLEILYVLHIKKELYQSPVVADHSRIIAKLKRYGLFFV